MGETPTTEQANPVGLLLSTAHERIRRLVLAGVIEGWKRGLDLDAFDQRMCAFALFDLPDDGDAQAIDAPPAHAGVQERHHVSVQ